MAMFWYQEAAAYMMPNLLDDPLGQYVRVVRESYVGRARSCWSTPILNGDRIGVARSPRLSSWLAAEMTVSKGGARAAGKTGGAATSATIGVPARKPCITMAIRAAPVPRRMVNQR